MIDLVFIVDGTAERGIRRAVDRVGKKLRFQTETRSLFIFFRIEHISRIELQSGKIRADLHRDAAFRTRNFRDFTIFAAPVQHVVDIVAAAELSLCEPEVLLPSNL